MNLIKNPYIKFIYVLIGYFILLFYTVNSTIFIFQSVYYNNSDYQEYQSMLDIKSQMQSEINILQTKVTALTQGSVNKDILEEAAKSSLGMIKTGETLVIIN